MRRIFTITGLPCLLWAAAAGAQSAAPVGYWTSDSGEQLTVSQDGTCGFGMNGQYTAVGSCSWDASGAGGILTILNQNAYQPAPVYFSVVWVDAQTITVFGDVFHRGG